MTVSPPRSATAVSDARKVNVLLMTTGLGIGGAEIVVRNLARSIDRRRFNVSVCCLKELGPVGEQLVGEGIDIVALKEKGQQHVDYFTFLRVRRLIRDRQIDVVHSHTAHGLADSCLCRFLVPGLRVVHTFHFGNYPHTNKTVLRLERIFSRLADRLVAVGNVQSEQIRNVYGLRKGRIQTVWNGVSPSNATPDEGFRKKIGAGGRVLVGTIATLIEQKGLRDLLKVARRCRDAGVEVHFVIVGDGGLRQELESLRDQMGLGDAVTFTGWVKNASEAALPSFDIYFQPSLWEAMSIAILEAMAAAKPVVATRVGETPHILEEGADGLLAEVGDIEAMAAAIAKLARDPELRRRLGSFGRQKALERFTVSHMTGDYESMYLDVLGRRQADVAER